MIPADHVAPPGQLDEIYRKLADLQRQLDEERAARRLAASSIAAGSLTVNGGNITLRAGSLRVVDAADNLIIELGQTSDGRYGLRVNDSDGNPQVRAGELASGGYGLEAVNGSGELVALSTLAFGAVTATVSTGESTTSTSYTNLATVGPSVTVDIGTSGRALVLLSATMITAAVDAGYMSVTLSGANAVAAADAHCLLFSPENSTGLGTFSGTRAVLFTGLAAGLTTFTAKYRTGGASGTFLSRDIAVLPY